VAWQEKGQKYNVEVVEVRKKEGIPLNGQFWGLEGVVSSPIGFPKIPD